MHRYRSCSRVAIALPALFVVLAGLTDRVSAQPAAADAALPGVSVVSSDARGLTLEIHPAIAFTTITGGLLLPTLDGGVLANAGDHGAPMDLRLVIPVALPQATGNSFEVIGATYGAPVAGRIAPSPTLVSDSLGMTHQEYRADAARYAETGLRAARIPAAELRYTGIARDVHTGAIGIAPYRYDAANNRILPLTSVRVRLTYAASGGGRVGTPGTGLSALTRNAFINSSVAGSWALPANRAPLGRTRTTAAARSYMRVEVKDEGLYEVRAEDFNSAGIDLSSVDPEHIAVYGGDGGPLSENDLAIDSLGMHQIPAIVEKANGRATRVLFYGVGPVRWRFAARTDSVPTHQLNPYVTANSYIIAVEGAPSMAFPASTPPGSADVTLTAGLGRLFFEEDHVNAVDIRKNGGSGRDWFASTFQVDASRPSDPRVFSMKLTGLDASQPVLYRVRCANAGRIGPGSGAGTFAFEQRDMRLGQFSIEGLSGERIAWARIGQFTGSGSDVAADNTSLLKITYSNQSTASGYLDWYEVHYGRRLSADNDQISFWSRPGTGTAQFVVQEFTSTDLLGFDVTNPANPLALVPSATDGRFVFNDRLGSTRHYFIAARSAARRVANPTSAKISNLRERMDNADMIVVTHPDFAAPAIFTSGSGSTVSPVDRYVRHRNESGIRTVYVTTEEIYNEFSNGNLDPTAIRNYLAWTFKHWTVQPSYVLLFGDGSYDYRSIATRQKALIPPYESDDGEVYDHIESTCFDDYFVRVTPDITPGTIDLQADIAVGRFPVETVEQADVVVDKVIRYETTKTFGTWRSTIALAADDDYPLGDGGGFTRQSESLWRTLPNWLEPKKIYVAAYPTEQIAARRKPGAEEDLQQTIDRGAIITNWVGHGNPNVWAHEYILEKDKFIPSLVNDTLLTYVPAVTCNFGYFDDPTVVSGGELFLLHPGGGAIAVMTATRAVYIGPNEDLMRKHFRTLFTRDLTTRRFPTIGQALLVTKYDRAGYNDNDQKFLLLGDPALRLNLPADSVQITSVNNIGVDTTVATVGALSQVAITGVVRDQFGTIRTGFNGRAIVSLYDADRAVKLETGEEVANVTYYGGRLFRGPALVKDGHFSITFRVPKDIAYDTATGRIHVYAYTDANDNDAAGATANVRVYGSDTTTVTDHDGPAVKLFVDDRSFRSGDIVSRSPLLIVDLADPSGINSSGSSIGHRIEAWIDDDARSVDLTDTYQTLPTDYGQGTAERRLTSLEPGEHKARVRAWDIYNNQSESTTYFRIGEDASELSVEDVVNYPNPMTRETDFLFRHNQTKPLAVSIAIYTTTGRKVRELDAPSVTDRFVRVHWDGTDADGQRVANGVYLYRLRVQVAGETEGRTYETIEKVAVVR